MKEQRKIVLVGTGFVGMSFAYALLNQSACDVLVLIDSDRKKAVGEAMDLNHGLAFAGSPMKIVAGDYDECADADIVAVCAGVAQKPGESRINLLSRNTAVFRSIIESVTAAGFAGIFLIATNPVDIMTQVTQQLSGFARGRVIGTGTTLDTARLRYMLGEYFAVDPRNVHAYVIGEHGDSEFVPWSQALIATKPIINTDRYSLEDMDKISDEVRHAAAKIIDAKKSTYYGIGMAMVRIVKAIFGNENSILTVSCYLDGEYGQHGVYAGVPAVVNRDGVREKVVLSLHEDELEKLGVSCEFLRDTFGQIVF